MLLFFKHKKVVRVMLAQRAMHNFSAQKKTTCKPIPCRRENRHSSAGSPIICGRLFRDIRTFGRAVEGSSVSPITNTMGGLSGGGRGSDTSGVCSAPSLIISRLCARALALDLGRGTFCPPFVIRKAYIRLQYSLLPPPVSTARRPCPCGASSDLRLPPEGISKSVILENVAQVFSEMLLKL